MGTKLEYHTAHHSYLHEGVHVFGYFRTFKFALFISLEHLAVSSLEGFTPFCRAASLIE